MKTNFTTSKFLTLKQTLQENLLSSVNYHLLTKLAFINFQLTLYLYMTLIISRQK